MVVGYNYWSGETSSFKLNKNKSPIITRTLLTLLLQIKVTIMRMVNINIRYIYLFVNSI
jgi:hypothetical protein